MMYDAAWGVTEDLVVLLLLALLILGAAPAWAGLPVAYDADYKTLKKNVYIGDPLAFELYETTDCSGAPVYSKILGAGTPEVTIEQVKPVPAKKEKPKPKSVDERSDSDILTELIFDSDVPVSHRVIIQELIVKDDKKALGEIVLARRKDLKEP